MASLATSLQPKTSCRDCAHRPATGFEEISCSGHNFMSAFKFSHEVAWTGDLIIRQDEPSGLIATLYSGLVIKQRRFGRGKRQVLSLLMPGDLLGLESLYSPVFSHSVEARTDITYCVFDNQRWHELLSVPEMASRRCKSQAMEPSARS